MTPITPQQLALDIDGFLAFKHALGYSYARGEQMLRSFQRYVTAPVGNAPSGGLETLVSGWLSRGAGRQPITVRLELGVLRQLCRYRQRADPHSFVPGRDDGPPAGQSHFLPYIFSPQEVRAIVLAANDYRGRLLAPTTLRTLLLIVYCTGLRLGEAVRLQRRDVALDPGVFTVRQSKGKTRLVPFRHDLALVLADYLTGQPARLSTAATAPFLVCTSGDAVSLHAASAAIRQVLRTLGLKPPRGRRGPRPYDLRHAFAVHRLTAWCREGVDLHACLPWLSAYMGHDNVLGTEVYLHATAELMGLASERFHARFQVAGPHP
jgi:integrase